MPKIVINEFDRTKASIGSYTNFTVVVPGYLGAEGSEAKRTEDTPSNFDQYGIYECSDQSKFREVIGFASPEDTIIQAAIAPVLADTFNGNHTFKKFDEDGNEILDEDEQPSSITVNFASEATGETAWNASPADGKVSNLELVRRAVEAENKRLYYAVTKTANMKYQGTLVDTSYQYVLIDSETTLDSIKNPTKFVTITIGKEGRDEVKGCHYGNQIAYELLGLGYTVLYKRLSAEYTSEDASAVGTDAFWAPLEDKSVYDFRYILGGMLDGNSAVNSAIQKLADKRKDCVALLDIPATSYADAYTQEFAIQKIIDAANMITESSYAAIFAPMVTYAAVDSQKEYDNNTTFPASFHYLACAAKAAENYNEWYAVAGYTRGISKYTIKSLGCKLGEAAINALEPRCANGITKAVNLIVKIKNACYL